MGIKKVSFSVLFFTICVLLSAQTGEEMLRGAISTNPTNNWGNMKQKGQWTTGANLGAFVYSTGDIYAGNFYGNKRHGYGIHIVPDGYYINDCPNAKYYVGNWSNDVKSGEGTCYNASGTLIYYGDFVNGKPTGTYPTVGYGTYKFQTLDASGDKYVGETKDGKRHGYGVFAWRDGGIWIGYWDEGERDGQGIYIAANGSLTVGYWNNNTHSSAPIATPAALANMVRIQGGTFTMGSPASEPKLDVSETQHQVTVSSFYMGKYQVTQKEYQAVMGTNPSYFKGDNLPVEMVSWYDALVYCNKLSMREGLSPAYRINGSTDPAAWGAVPTDSNATWNAVAIVAGSNGYRLPTEAQWEYACRAGTTTPFSTGNNITTSQANYDGNYPYNNNAKGEYRKKTTPVGSFAPNAWGLYDMHGNVYEWCWDWYGSYASGAQTDPGGAVSGYYRVRRGGSWDDFGRLLRSASRDSYNPGYRSYYDGFRLVCP